MAWMQHDIIGKSLQLLKEIVPQMSRLADLWNPLNPATQRDFREIQTEARTLGIVVHSAEVRAPKDFVSAFSSITRTRANAVIVQVDPLTIAHRKEIIHLAAQNRLPSMFFMRQFVDDGGLISYGANLSDQYRRAAGYVAKILKEPGPPISPCSNPRSSTW
jgi:putative ABC transport system substrate-binding protein